MDEEQKRLNNLKRIETWKKKKALKAEIEAKQASIPSASLASLEKMHEIQTHLLPKTKIIRDQVVGFKETLLVDEVQLKAAAVARLLMRLKECREDPIKFTEFVMKDPQGRNLVLKDFHKDWLNAFQRDGRIVVEASRNHAKTTILVSYLLWKIGQNPNVRIKLFSQNDARARERIAEIANNIETNEAYHLVFPEIKPKKGQWSNNRIVVERPLSLKDATVDGLGITTSATGGRCVVPGTLVIGPGGPKPIEKFETLDRVLTSDGKYHKITATASKEYSGDIITIKPECFEPFKTTPEHQVLVCRWDYEGPKSSWVRADEIQKRDLLVIPRATTGSSHKIFHNAEKQARTDLLFSDPLTWFVLGFYLGDGWCDDPEGIGGRGNKINTIGLALDKVKDADLIPLFENWASRHDGTSWVYVRDQVASVYVSQPELAELCRLFNKGAHNKRVPYWVERATFKHQRDFMRGYWRADGCLVTDTATDLQVINYVSCNLELLIQIQQMGLTQGCVFSLSKMRDPGPAIICGKETWQTSAWQLQCTDPTAHQMVGHLYDRTDNESWELKRRSFVAVDHALIPVRTITKENYTGLVYDLTVKDVPNFVVPGATLHNCDVIALDDVCDLNNSVVYPTVRERIIQKFAGELLPMLDPGGQVISVATPYHALDLTASLKSNPEFKHIRHVVGNDQDPMLPLWPERWGREALQSLRIQQGATEFDRAYRCLAFSGETVPCKPEWIKFYTKEELGDPSRMVCIQAYDLAIEQKSTSDYFACVTVLYDMERGKAFIADAKHERISFSSQGHRIIGNFLRWNPDRIVIEKVGLGGSLENYLNENSHIRLPLVPYKPRGDKYFRLMQQLHWLEDGKCTFHPNMDPVKQVLEEDGNLIKELLEFPVGRHDDLVDAMVMCLFALEEFRNHEAEAGWYDGGSMKAKMSVVG